MKPLSAFLQGQIDAIESNTGAHVYVIGLLDRGAMCFCVPAGSEGRAVANPFSTMRTDTLKVADADTFRDARDPFVCLLSDDPRVSCPAFVPERRSLQ